MSLYGAPPIPLVHRDAYTLLVAVLLSAQCTDKRVNLVTPALFALASTPEEMARQDVAAVREIVRPCGLSERKASIQVLVDLWCALPSCMHSICVGCLSIRKIFGNCNQRKVTA